MSLLEELQDLAEGKASDEFMDRGTFKRPSSCVHSILVGVQNALGGPYADPQIIKASNTLSGGFWAGVGPCGALQAGALAIGLKYGTEDHKELAKIYLTGRRAVIYCQWFKEQFGAYTCAELAGIDFKDVRRFRELYSSCIADYCNDIVRKSTRRIVFEVWDHGRQGEGPRPKGNGR
jgi:hypothetical protein